jgi:hypothetical protein
MFEKWEVFPHKFHCLFGFNEHFVVLIRLGQEVPSDARMMEDIHQFKAMINISRLQFSVFFGNGKDLCVLLELVYMKAYL